MKCKCLLLALVLISVAHTASAKTFYFLLPWNDPSHVVIGYKQAMDVVKSPYTGSDYWEWKANGYHMVYFDLYIPEARYQDVYLKLTWGDDGAGLTGIHIYASPTQLPDWTPFATLDWSKTPAVVALASTYKSIYLSDEPNYEKTITVKVPQGFPYVRVLLWDNDDSGQLKVRLWKEASYSVAGVAPTPTPSFPSVPSVPSVPTPTPKVSISISNIYGISLLGLGIGTALTIYAFRRKIFA